MRPSRLTRGIVLGAAALGLVASSGCFGSFQATRKLYAYNKSMGDKWVQEFVFLAFSIIPVYALVNAGDVLIFNSVEFWTGNNPITSVSVTGTDDGRQLRQTRQVVNHARVLTIEELKDGQTLSTTTMTMPKSQDAITVTTTFADGRVVSRTVTKAEADALIGR
ncbi:MAG: DUF3332 family protein [Gemmatimonadaceae bacterium]|nr:DUF3332 family protein [Gemmatimonadaceae bacterium]